MRGNDHATSRGRAFEIAGALRIRQLPPWLSRVGDNSIEDLIVLQCVHQIMSNKLDAATLDRLSFIVRTPESELAIRSISYASASTQTGSKE